LRGVREKFVTDRSGQKRKKMEKRLQVDDGSRNDEKDGIGGVRTERGELLEV